MDGQPVLGPAFYLVTILYLVCITLTSYCALAGFYASVNPSPWALLRYLKNYWLKIILTMIPLVLIFWFTASHAAVYCRVKREAHEENTGYYFHRMSLFLPACGTVGVWTYGEFPPKAIKGFTLWQTEERVVLHSSLAIYLVLICFMNAWVLNFVLQDKWQRLSGLKKTVSQKRGH